MAKRGKDTAANVKKKACAVGGGSDKCHGVCGAVVRAVAGPLVIWMVLMAHVAYQHSGFAGTDPVTMEDFPADVSPQAREATIKSRKALLKEHIEALSGRPSQKYLDSLVAADGVYEDPLQRYVGLDEIRLITGSVCPAFLASSEFDIHGEHHGPHEIVLDWTRTFRINVFGLTTVGPVSLPMRQRISLAAADKPGDPERIVRVTEEWRGKALLTEQNTMPLYGRLQSNLRRFTGFLLVKTVGLFF